MPYTKEYYDKNRDTINEKKRNYYLANRDEILAKQKIKIYCNCMCWVNRSGLSKHLKSQKHLAWEAFNKDYPLLED